MPESNETSVSRAADSTRDVYRSVDSYEISSVDENTDGPVVIRGHFSTYDPYEIRSYVEGHFIERIEPGAFQRTFDEDRDSIRLMLSHGHDPQVGEKPLGVITVLREDAEGAYYEAELFDVGYVNDLLPALRAKQYGASFRFSVEEDGQVWSEGKRSEANPDGLDERKITSVRVREVGPTVFGANPKATSSIRSLTDAYNPELALERRKAVESEKHMESTVEVEVKPQALDTIETETEVRHEETTEETGTEEVRSEEVETVTESVETRNEETSTDDTEQKGQTMTNMSAEEREHEIEKIDARQAELDAKYEDRSLEGDDATEYATLETERAEHVAAVAAIKARKDAIAERAAATGSTETVERKAPNVIRKSENPYDLREVYKAASSEADILRGVKDSAKRIIEERSFAAAEENGVDRSKNQAHLEKLLVAKDGDGAVSRHIMETGSPAYRSGWLKWAGSRGLPFLEGEEARDLALGGVTTGGYKVPFDLDPTLILTSAGVINPLREMASVKTVVAREWQGVTSAGTSVTRASDSGEADPVTVQNPVIGQVRANTQRVDARVNFSIEIDAADPANLSDLLMILREAKETEEANSFINGAGDGLTGPKGISRGLTGAALVEMTTAFNSDHLYELDNELDPRHQANAQFLARKSTYNAVRKLGSATDGGDIWERTLGPGNPNQVIGYAARIASHMPAMGAAGDVDYPFLILGDFSKFLIVDRIGMVMDIDPFVVNGDGLHTGQRALVAYWWNGSQILDNNAFRGLVDAA